MNVDGNIKLCDFGLSKEGLIGISISFNEFYNIFLIDGVGKLIFVGTPYYMGTEIFVFFEIKRNFSKEAFLFSTASTYRCNKKRDIFLFIKGFIAKPSLGKCGIDAADI